MKKLLFILVAFLLLSSCTDLYETDDIELIYETQATDKNCASNPNAPGCLCPDPSDPTCN